MSKKILGRWLTPLACFMAGSLLAIFAGTSGAFNYRMMMNTTEPPCDKCPEGQTMGGSSGTGGSSSNCSSSGNPVRYFNGQNLYSVKELQVGGLEGWTHGRSYISDATLGDGLLGAGWRIQSLPQLVNRGAETLVMAGSTPLRAFINSGGTYSPTSFYKDTLTATSQWLVLTDPVGSQWVFYTFLPGAWDPSLQGKLYQIVNRTGIVTASFIWSSTAGPTFGKLLEVDLIDQVNPSNRNVFLYNYNLSGVALGLMSDVTYRRVVASVATTVRKVDYTYYSTTTLNGPTKTLQRAIITNGSTPLEVRYYRYNALDGQGRLPVRTILEPSGYARAKAALGSDAAIDSATDAVLATYADYYFEYDASLKVTKEIAQGAGCGCGTGAGAGAFTYTTVDSPLGLPDGPNTWKRKTTEILPDLSTNTIYTNGLGSTMLSVFKDVTTGNQWRTYHQYDADGREILMALPSAVTGHDDTIGALVTSAMLNATGTYHLFDYYAATNLPAGAVAGYRSGERVKQGIAGTPIPKSTLKYTSHVGTTFVGSVTVYPVASKTVYRTTGGGGPITTSYAYTWQGTSNQVLQKTTTLPIDLATQNGSGTAVSFVEQADLYGRLAWVKDEEGFIHSVKYDVWSGAATQQVSDVNTSLVTDEPAGWVTPAGGGLHLVQSHEVDPLGRSLKATSPGGDVTYSVYNDVTREIRTYPSWDPATNLPTGPTRVSREDRAGSYREHLTMGVFPAVAGGRPTGTEAIFDMLSLQRVYTDKGGRPVTTDTYFNVTGLAWSTAPNIGTIGVHYYRALRNYDTKGRLDRNQDWTGTISRVVYDSLDRLKSNWVGTDDTPTSGDWSPANTAGTNLIKTKEVQYDANGVGDSNETKILDYTSASTFMTTELKYDFQGRVVQMRRPDFVTFVFTLDNLGRATTEQAYADANQNFALDAGELRAATDNLFTERGLAYRSVVHNVDPSTGALGNQMTMNAWYNPRGLRIKVKSPNGLFSKHQYDGVQRSIASFVCYNDAETTYAAASSVAGNTVVRQLVNTFDPDGNVILGTSYDRVDTSTKLGDLSLSWAVADSRRNYTATWYDLADRPTFVVSYGTNGGTTLVRPAAPPAPGNSTNIDVQQLFYERGGWLATTIDNGNRINRSRLDALGRPTHRVENLTGNDVVTETDLDINKTVDFVYDTGGRLSKLIAYNAKGAGLGVQQQVTQYVYGTTANQASPAVYRNDLRVAEIYPDSDDVYNPAGPNGSKISNGADGVYDRVEATVDYASRALTLKDQRGGVHTKTYDSAGRLFTDAVTTLAAGVDGAVRRIEYGYDSISRNLTTSSYSAVTAGTLLNQTKYTYDGWGRDTTLTQSHNGAVIAGTPAVTDGFAEGASGIEAKYVRKASTTYPNGRQVFFNYPAAGSLGDHLNRIDNIAADGAAAAQHAKFGYLGISDFMDETHPQVANGLVLRVGSGGAPSSWDQLSRTIETKWRNTANTFTHDLFNYTYDLNSNPVTKKVTPTTAPPTPKDEAYTYDGQSRLTKMNRGALSGTPPTISDVNANYAQAWTALEPLGNWRSFKVAPSGANNYTFVQNRSHNIANEIDVDTNDANAAGASITGAGTAAWVAPTYDKEGSMLSGPKPKAETTRMHYTYDAWGRLVKSQNDNAGVPGTTAAEYVYDGDHRRIAKLKPNVGTPANWDRTDYYYSASWQVVEERTLVNSVSKTSVATAPRFQFLWDLRSLDTVLLRDENKDADGSCTGAADQRLFYTQDNNSNTTALVTTAGTVVERYVYDPYGNVTVLSANWATQPATTYNNEVLFGGYHFDSETGLYYARMRHFHPTLGRWLSRDPDSYVDGFNLYQYVGGHPTTQVDPFGLQGEVGKPEVKNKSGIKIEDGCPEVETINLDKDGEMEPKSFPGGVNVSGKWSVSGKGGGKFCKVCCSPSDTKPDGHKGKANLEVSASITVGVSWGIEKGGYLGGKGHWRYDFFIGVKVDFTTQALVSAAVEWDSCARKSKMSLKAELSLEFTGKLGFELKVSGKFFGKRRTFTRSAMFKLSVKSSIEVSQECTETLCQHKGTLKPGVFNASFEADLGFMEVSVPVVKDYAIWKEKELYNYSSETYQFLIELANKRG